MLVFGVDIPLVEVILVFMIITFIMLVEAIIVIALLIKHLNKTKKLGELTKSLSDTILQIKGLEIQELDKIKVTKR